MHHYMSICQEEWEIEWLIFIPQDNNSSSKPIFSFTLSKQFRKFVQFWCWLSQKHLCWRYQVKHSKQLQTEEICLLSEVTKYIFYFLIAMDEKDTKVSLFYLMSRTNSNSHENKGILVRFQWFFFFFCLISLLFLQVKHSNQILTKEICLSLESTKYISFLTKILKKWNAV